MNFLCGQGQCLSLSTAAPAISVRGTKRCAFHIGVSRTRAGAAAMPDDISEVQAGSSPLCKQKTGTNGLRDPCSECVLTDHGTHSSTWASEGHRGWTSGHQDLQQQERVGLLRESPSVPLRSEQCSAEGPGHSDSTRGPHKGPCPLGGPQESVLAPPRDLSILLHVVWQPYYVSPSSPTP